MANGWNWHPQELLNAVDKRVQGIVLGACRFIERDVQRQMRSPHSGRIYTRRTVQHQASAPGEAPAIDTGRFRQSITHIVVRGGPGEWRGYVGSNVKYARWLELGTHRMEPRPMWLPAMLTLRAHIDEVMAGAKLAFSEEAGTYVKQ